MMKYVHKKTFQAKYSDVDFKDELKPSAILAYLQETACTSADELGFGYEFLKPKQLGFITANTYVKILKPVGIEEFSIHTWPTPPRHVIFDRQYELYNAAGEQCVVACSRWCLVDMTTFKMLPASTLSDQDYASYNPDKAITPQWKIEPLKKEEAEQKFSLTIGNSEYDHYMHVNNTRYADYLFNCFSVEELKSRRLTGFQLNYINQSHEGDVLSVYREAEDEKTYRVHILNQNGDTIVAGKVMFE